MADETATEGLETTPNAENLQSEGQAIVETTDGDESPGNADQDGDSEVGEDGLPEDKPRGRKNVQARIDELTRQAREAERQAAYYKRLATEKAPNSADAAPTEPNPADFDDYGDYVKALAKHTVEQERRNIHGETAESFRAEAWSSKVEATRASLSDYDKVVGSSEIPIAGHVADALMEADRGPELAYHIAQNPDVADRLNKMSPSKAMMEMGRLESTLGTVQPKPASKAPAPINPTRAGPTAKVDLSKASMDDYIAERRKQGARY